MNIPELRAKILEFALHDDNIRAVIETGAFAREFPPADELSDLDIEFYARTPELLLQSNAWFENFGTMWVFLKLENDGDNPTRLVIYSGGAKVDFTIYDAAKLNDNRLNQAQTRGFIVHIDKDASTKEWRAAPPQIAAKPDLELWHRCRSDFWFECYNWAKYLARGDLWHAKMREAEVKTYLLQMLEWHAATRGVDSRHLGHFMRDWTDETTWREIETLWAAFDVADNFRALNATLNLFARIEREVGAAWNYPLEGVDEKGIRGFVDDLAKRGDSV
jgi:aminoglycoside 6-adenylyltransferase